MTISKKIAALAALLILPLLLSACGNKVPNTVHSVEDVKGKTVGVMASTPGEESVERRAETDEYTVKRYFDSAELAEDLTGGATDCAVVSRQMAESIVSRYGGIKMISEPYSDQGYRIALPKGNGMMFERVSQALAKIERDGTLEKMKDGWLSGNGYEFEYEEPAEDADTVMVGVNMGAEPYEYDDSNGNPTGLEIDILRAICRELGVKYELVDGDSQQMIYLVESGKVSFAIGRILESDSLDAEYTDSYLTDEQYVLTRK